MGNNALLKDIPETRSTGITKRTAFAQICHLSRQQITSNNMNNSAQSQTADQLAMRTRLQRGSLSPLSHPVFTTAPTESVVTWISLKKIQISDPM
ncbi:hypothetical protein AVEN_205048-1 [Araneus ventricosus]|uniref:Uncharacterized protein n=1 Tax=Araneus ventricosus TaxID=182803 RepID=A0A4Y2VTK2_ARAVE|nr:hypothetical protein AVEN_205048-1 [Araneus ventricosus]